MDPIIPIFYIFPLYILRIWGPFRFYDISINRSYNSVIPYFPSLYIKNMGTFERGYLSIMCDYYI